MTTPTIHLNGTSRNMLAIALCNASNALDEAYKALKETAPNGRDYYPQGDKAIYAAQEEHMARLRKVDEVKKEIDAITESIQP